jgi:hypothetical protein
MPNSRPSDRFIHDPGADSEAGHEHHQEEPDVLVEYALPGLVGEDQDRLEDESEKSPHGHQQGATPGRTQATDKKQNQQAETHQPPENPRNARFFPEGEEVRHGQSGEEPGEPDHDRGEVADRPDVRIHRDCRLRQPFLQVETPVVCEEVMDIGGRNKAGPDRARPEALIQNIR